MRPFATLLAVTLLLAACSPQGRRMPDLENEADITAAIAGLSPWEDARDVIIQTSPVC